MNLKNPIFVALDVDTDLQAYDLAEKLSEVVGGFKIGPRLCLKYGEEFVKKLSQFGPVFMDNKHFDIPSTMLASIKASFDCGASFVTIHALAGLPALKEIAKLEEELNRIRPFKVLCVTILTSWDQNHFSNNFVKQSSEDHVKALSQLIIDSGLSGIVCSPKEIEILNGRSHFIVTPGIRMPEDELNDQLRILSPKEAIIKGAQMLVVGRPIIKAKDPMGKAQLIVENINLK